MTWVKINKIILLFQRLFFDVSCGSFLRLIWWFHNGIKDDPIMPLWSLHCRWFLPILLGTCCGNDKRRSFMKCVDKMKKWIGVLALNRNHHDIIKNYQVCLSSFVICKGWSGDVFSFQSDYNLLYGSKISPVTISRAWWHLDLYIQLWINYLHACWTLYPLYIAL